MSVLLKNPLLPGFYPDPSICRVEDDFYMVTSSFSYFPGVPIFHSKDLAHWEQIGHVLDRPEQLPLSPYNISGGIFAPTIRYHNGLFYMITTNFSVYKNFIVTAKNPAGPWSEPHWIEGAEGIDPSLFWDDDGKAYYTGTSKPHEANGNKPMIWLSEIDLEKFELIGEKKYIWEGSLSEPAWPEAPHIYKVNDYYYLMIAEGGTEHFHAESIARASNVKGPYFSYRGNPIMTQRHLGMNVPITNTGHADLVELKDGSWYVVFLASRPYGGYHKNLGRETFIAPVVWEEEFPLVSQGTGQIQFEYEGPDLPLFSVQTIPVKDDFDHQTLSYIWNFLGTPDKDTYKIEDGYLKLKLYATPLSHNEEKKKSRPVKPETLGFLGRRQQHMSFTASTCLDFEPEENQTAGLTLLQNDYHQIRLEIGKNVRGEKVIRALRCYRSMDICLLQKAQTAEYREEILEEIPWSDSEVIFRISALGQEHRLIAESLEGKQIQMAVVDGGFLGTETAGGYVGAYIGMFASGNGIEYDKYAAFDWFIYEGTE